MRRLQEVGLVHRLCTNLLYMAPANKALACIPFQFPCPTLLLLLEVVGAGVLELLLEVVGASGCGCQRVVCRQTTSSSSTTVLKKSWYAWKSRVGLGATQHRQIVPSHLH